MGGFFAFWDLPNQAADNYIYDANGSLVENVTDSIRLSWNVQKKVDSVRFTNGNLTLYYTYDAQGNRLSNRTNPDFANYYVRDAQGNALATYSLKKDSLYLIEQNLYGSSRLGVKNLAILAQIDTQRQQMSDTLRIFEERVGAKNYELSNHLGNVLATISDKTIFNTDHYNGIVYSAQLYYPFGWEIPTLSYTAKKYRFGFNGKEDDREWHAQDYGFRLYTPREARFISVDPITAEYPELTPYQFASNTPIQAVDLDGLEAAVPSFGEGGASQATNATELRKQFELRRLYLVGEQTPGEPNRRKIKKGYGTDIIIQDEQGNLSSFYFPPSGAITPVSDPITGGAVGFFKYGAKAFATEVFSWGIEQAIEASGDPLAEMQLNTLDKKASFGPLFTPNQVFDAATAKKGNLYLNNNKGNPIWNSKTPGITDNRAEMNDFSRNFIDDPNLTFPTLDGKYQFYPPGQNINTATKRLRLEIKNGKMKLNAEKLNLDYTRPDGSKHTFQTIEDLRVENESLRRQGKSVKEPHTSGDIKSNFHINED